MLEPIGESLTANTISAALSWELLTAKAISAALRWEPQTTKACFVALVLRVVITSDRPTQFLQASQGPRNRGPGDGGAVRPAKSKRFLRQIVRAPTDKAWLGNE